MSAQRQLSLTLRQNFLSPTGWVVLKHHNKGIVTDACQRLLDITLARHALHLAPVLHTGNDDGVRIATNNCTLVEQQAPAKLPFCLFCLGDKTGFRGFVAVKIGGIVVITHNAIDTILGMQLLEQCRMLLQFVGMQILQIACKDYHVRLECVDAVNGTLQHALRTI